MITQITTVVVSVVFTALITFFVTTVARKSSIKEPQMIEYVTKSVGIHERINHKKDLVDFVEEKISEHEESCTIAVCLQKIESLERMVIWLVIKNGGNIKELTV